MVENRHRDRIEHWEKDRYFLLTQHFHRPLHLEMRQRQEARTGRYACYHRRERTDMTERVRNPDRVLVSYFNSVSAPGDRRSHHRFMRQ